MLLTNRIGEILDDHGISVYSYILKVTLQVSRKRNGSSSSSGQFMVLKYENSNANLST